MKIIKILTALIFVFIYNTVSSQVIKWNFFNYSHVPTENGNVLVSAISPTPFKVNITLSRPVIQPWVGLPIKGEIELFYNYLGQERILYATTFSTSDWQTGSALSNVITKDAIFPQILTSSITYVDVNVRYRYYRDNYPNPENTNGWTDWYILGNTTKFMLSIATLPESVITGPNAICNEGIYTITNPYSVSLENATAIATLTSLGNNQWKVTNVSGGGSAKTVKLRSTIAGKSFDYDIVIGGGHATSIQGPSSGHGGEMFEFTMEYAGEGTIKWKCNSPLVDMSFGTTGPNLLIQTAELLRNQKNQEVLIEGIFTSTCGVVTQINKRLILNP